MKEIGYQYELGFAIQYNYDPIIPGKGSAIFFHIWNKDTIGTAGCTVMEKAELQKVIAWLDQTKHPHVIQYPESFQLL